MTATTTYPAIRNQWVSVVQALTPAFKTDRKYRLFTQFPPELTFEEWCAENPKSCFRKFHVRRAGPRELPMVNNADVVQIKANAEMVVAYPKAYAEYNRSDARREILDIEDVLDADGEQINFAIGVLGAANYLDGQSLCTAEQDSDEDALVAFLLFDLEATYYEDVTLTEPNALQNSSEQSFQYTTTVEADTFTIPIPYRMADTSYVVSAIVSHVPAGGSTAILQPVNAGRTRSQFTLNASGDLAIGTIIDIIVRDA